MTGWSDSEPCNLPSPAVVEAIFYEARYIIHVAEASDVVVASVSFASLVEKAPPAIAKIS